MTMAGTAAAGWKRADQLRVGDWFHDPDREGRIPAVVVEIVHAAADGIHFTLDDTSKWKPWGASYPVGRKVELCDPPEGATPVFRETVKARVDTGGKPIEVLGFTARPARVEIRIGAHDRAAFTTRDEAADVIGRFGRAMAHALKAWDGGREARYPVTDWLYVETTAAEPAKAARATSADDIVLFVSVGGGLAEAADTAAARALKHGLVEALRRAVNAVPW
jgi:hypothetical protein